MTFVDIRANRARANVWPEPMIRTWGAKGRAASGIDRSTAILAEGGKDAENGKRCG